MTTPATLAPETFDTADDYRPELLPHGTRVVCAMRGTSVGSYRDGIVTDTGPGWAAVLLDAGYNSPSRTVRFTHDQWEDGGSFVLSVIDSEGRPA